MYTWIVFEFLYCFNKTIQGIRSSNATCVSNHYTTIAWKQFVDFLRRLNRVCPDFSNTQRRKKDIFSVTENLLYMATEIRHSTHYQIRPPIAQLFNEFQQ